MLNVLLAVQSVKIQPLACHAFLISLLIKISASISVIKGRAIKTVFAYHVSKAANNVQTMMSV